MSGPITLAAGRFELPAASAFGAPGFHEVFELSGAVAGDVPTGGGGRLVVSLRDVSRPSQDCRSHHPLSGCATVDWSDAPGRPSVPSGGVFDNSLTVETASGPATRYLSETDRLADSPDRFDPG